jgi:hypothetical protein
VAAELGHWEAAEDAPVDALIERIRARIAEGRPCDLPGEWLPLQPAAEPEAVTDAEARLGFPLPELLRRLYTEVGNGGYGPAFGLLPVSAASLGPDPPAEAEFDLVGQYAWLSRAEPDRVGWTGWRPGLVPVFYLGCTVFEFVDCLAPGGPVVILDLGAEMEPQPPVPSLAARLEMWLSGEEPW